MWEREAGQGGYTYCLELGTLRGLRAVQGLRRDLGRAAWSQRLWGGRQLGQRQLQDKRSWVKSPSVPVNARSPQHTRAHADPVGEKDTQKPTRARADPVGEEDTQEPTRAHAYPVGEEDTRKHTGAHADPVGEEGDSHTSPPGIMPALAGPAVL